MQLIQVILIELLQRINYFNKVISTYICFSIMDDYSIFILFYY